SYIDDPEVAEYLGTVGARLTQETAGARHDFEFFAMRDASINAFALPGGFVGVHSGLLTASDTESELASVLGHEIAHDTQRRLAHRRRRYRARLPAHAPDDRRAHRGRAEPSGVAALQAAPRQPGLPAGAGKAARRHRRRARGGGAFRERAARRPLRERGGGTL